MLQRKPQFEVVGLAQSFYFQMLETLQAKQPLPEHPISSRFLRHAAWVRNKFHPVNKEGRPDYDVELPTFGEVCMARVPFRAHKQVARTIRATDVSREDKAHG